MLVISYYKNYFDELNGGMYNNVIEVFDDGFIYWSQYYDVDCTRLELCMDKEEDGYVLIEGFDYTLSYNNNSVHVHWEHNGRREEVNLMNHRKGR